MNSITQIAIQALRNKDLGQIAELEQNCSKVYNYFVHNPKDILTNENPYIIGDLFYYFGRFEETDIQINEVKGENAYMCFSRCLELRDSHDEQDIISCKFAAAKLIIYLSDRRHYFVTLFQEVFDKKCSNLVGSNRSLYISKCGYSAFNQEISNYIDYVRTFLFSILKANSEVNIVLPHEENQYFNLIMQDIQQKLDISENSIKKGEYLHKLAVSVIKESILI